MRDRHFLELRPDSGVPKALIEGKGGESGIEGHHGEAAVDRQALALPDQRASDSLSLEIMTDRHLSHLYFAMIMRNKDQTGDQILIDIAGKVEIACFGAKLFGGEDQPEGASKNIVTKGDRFLVLGRAMLQKAKDKRRGHGGESTTSGDARYIGDPTAIISSI